MKGLLVFEQKEVCDLLSFSLESQFQVNLNQAARAEEAMHILESEPVDFVVCDHLTTGPKLFELIQSKGVSTQLFSSSDQEPVEPGARFLDRSRLIEALTASLKEAFPDKLQPCGEGEPYTRIRGSAILKVSPLPGDIYVRLSAEKHVRVFKAGDSFSSADLEHFLERKNIEFLYIRSQDRAAFTESLKTACLSSFLAKKEPVTAAVAQEVKAGVPTPEERAKKLEQLKAKMAELESRKLRLAGARAERAHQEKTDWIKSKAMEIVAKARGTAPEPTLTPKQEQRLQEAALASEVERDLISSLEEVMEMSTRLGFSKEVQAITKVKVSETIALVRRAPALTEILAKLSRQKDKYLASHSVLLAHVGCSLASTMEWRSDTTYQKLTLAAFLHDITMTNNELAAVESLAELKEKQDSFTPEEIRSYKNHPIAAAELVKTMHEVPPDVDQIIIQHHERPDGSGFPRGLNHLRIGPLSAVFIVAHDLVSFLFRRPDVPFDETAIQEFMSQHAGTYRVTGFAKILGSVPKIKV